VKKKEPFSESREHRGKKRSAKPGGLTKVSIEKGAAAREVKGTLRTETGKASASAEAVM